MYRLALLSVHGCPMAPLGERDTGGMNVYLLQIARELGRCGHKVDVFTRHHEPGDPQVIDLGDNARVVHLKAGPYFETKGSLHQYIREFLGNLYLFQQSEGTTYDVVHSHYWLSGWAGTELSIRWDVPHVATFHTLARRKIEARAEESESQLRIHTESRVMRSVDAIVVSTEQEKQDLSRLYQVSTHKVCVIPAGVDLKLFRPLDKAWARQSLGLMGKRVVLSVGRVEPLKGLDIAIRAMAGLEDARDTRLIIVGGNPGRDSELRRLKSMSAQMGLHDRITFAGAMDQSNLPTYYNAADVFVLPSYYESFGLVALEAMACGVPVIASRVGGPETLVSEGKTGYLIASHTPEPYAQALNFLLANPTLRGTFGRAAIAKARTMGWDRVANRILALYSAMLEQTWKIAVGT